MYSTQKLTTLNQTSFNGYPVIPGYNLCVEYLQRINELLDRAMAENARSVVLRFDLHLPVALDCPDYPVEYDSTVITRFIESFKAQVQADKAKKERSGERWYGCTVRYVWAKEINSSVNPHYHVALILNRDAYFGFGQYSQLGNNIAGKIYRAWASALMRSPEESMSLVHIPDNPVYRLDRNALDYSEQCGRVFYRLSYLAKLETKQYGTRSKNFATSRT